MMNSHTPKDGEHIALLGIISNIFLTTVKFLSGIFGNSYALIADAIESATDIIGSLIVYFGVRFSQKPADTNHPYGHGKVEPMAGFVVSILLIFAAIEIIRGALERIRNPEVGVPETWTLYILIGVIVLKGTLFVRAFIIGKNIQSTAVKGDAWHHLSDALTTSIALIGTMIAVFFPGAYPSAADYAALLAGGFMFYNVFNIGYPALRELLDEYHDTSLETEIRTFIATHAPEILHTNLCIARKSGFDRILELELLIDGEKTVREGHLIGHRLIDMIKNAYPQVTHVSTHMEPSYEVVG